MPQNRESTAKNYLNIWRIFNKFLLRLDKPLRKKVSWEDKMALFGAYLIDLGHQSSTVASHFSAIKGVLKADGYKWNDQEVFLGTLIRSCRLSNDVIKNSFTHSQEASRNAPV